MEAKLDASGVVLELAVVDAQRVALERLDQLGAAATERAKRAADLTSRRLSSLSIGKGKLVALAVGGTAAVIALVAGIRLFWGDGLSKGALKDQINEQLEQQGPVCWPETEQQAANLKFPVFLETVPGFIGSRPILTGLVNAGYLSSTPHPMRFGSGHLYDITPKGQKAKVWDPQHGFCVGKRQVDEVLDWTVPGEGEQQVTQINYTWKVAKRPGWADDEAFAAVPGIGKSEQAHSVAQKTNKGWKVVF